MRRLPTRSTVCSLRPVTRYAMHAHSCRIVVALCSEGEVATLTTDEIRRLQREAVAARRVKHMHCMQCYGFYIAHDKSKFYLLLEFLAVLVPYQPPPSVYRTLRAARRVTHLGYQ